MVNVFNCHVARRGVEHVCCRRCKAEGRQSVFKQIGGWKAALNEPITPMSADFRFSRIDDEGTLSIDEDDDAPMVVAGGRRKRTRRSLQPPPLPASGTESPAFDDGHESNPETMFAEYKELTQYIVSTCADVDMLVMHQYNISDLSTHFPFNLVALENRIFRHRGYTERAEYVAEGVHHVIMNTSLFLGTINFFQILVEGITAERSDEIKDFFLTQLQTDKSLYQGFVSSNVKRGVISRKGCVISVKAFLRLCLGCGVQKISLGRFGQKTPWAEFEQFNRHVVPSCEKISIDVAFNFPVPQNRKMKECIPLFCYANNPSRSALMFHTNGQKLLNRKMVNWGWVRYP